jgi:CRISPR-associated protein Cmr2
VAGDVEVRGERGDPVTIHPFEILTIGGDDVMLIAPADRAIPIACAISRGFERTMREKLAAAPDLPAEVREATYTLSGGVVLAADRNPVRFLRDLAKQLQDGAKRARRDAGSAQSYLDFLVLTSGDIAEQNVRHLRQGYPYTLEGPPRLRMGMRPYPASVLQALWQGVGALRDVNFPDSQMAQLSEALLSGRREATLFYLYQLGRDRARSKRPYPALDRVLRAVQQPDDAKDPLPWVRLQDEEHDYATALWDVAELFSFARRKEGV